MKKPIKLYALSTCSHCKATKKLLDTYHVDYECTDVDLLEVLERAVVVAEIRQLNPQCSFPTIVIGERIIVGYREDEIREALELS